MRLRELLNYDTVVVQCHDNPDADAIASGWALYFYFAHHGKRVRFVYGGPNEIRKSNLRLLTETLRVPIEHVQALDEPPELLVTVDCQHGERNVTPLDGRTVAMIDHHQIAPSSAGRPLAEIRPQYGACSTVVWSMLRDEGIDANQCDASAFTVGPDNRDRRLATALYYGLYTDTMKLQEIAHPRDKDMRDMLRITASQIYSFQNSNLSLDELKIAGRALDGYKYNTQYRFAIASVMPCDPNILGVISDLLIEVDAIDACAVFCPSGDGVKLSVRSCVRQTRADELAREIARDVGNGGGHLRKAGGYLSGPLLRNVCDGAADDLTLCAQGLIEARMADYFANTDILNAPDEVPALTQAPFYRKQPVTVGYVRVSDVCPAGTELLVRTLEGDFEVLVDDTLCIMIGVSGEIYPIREDTLRHKYALTEAPYGLFTGDYPPTVRDTATGDMWELLPHARCCAANENDATLVHALRLTRRTKVFTAWSEDNYMLGLPGDLLVASVARPEDKYIVEGNIFERTYRAASDA